MKLSRNFTNVFNWTLDNLIPPIIRDSRVLNSPLFLMLFGKKGKLFMNFKNSILNLNSQQIIEYYENLSDVHIKRETDLNTESLYFILNNIVGDSVLDISSGRGYLSKKIVQTHKVKVIGVDFIINEELKKSKNPLFIEGTIEKIPFPDNHFDTVISTHTLEHVLYIQQSIDELRRVCKKQLIIVLPKQREYRYTFDLHVHFFPYKFSVLRLMNNKKGQCQSLKNDWVYHEKLSN